MSSFQQAVKPESLVQSRVLTKCSGHIPNQLVLLCQNKLFLSFQILMLFLKHPLWNPLQFLCNVKVTTALCFMRWLILRDDEYVFYTALNLLLGWFLGLVNVYKGSPCLWPKQSSLTVLSPFHGIQEWKQSMENCAQCFNAAQMEKTKRVWKNKQKKINNKGMLQSGHETWDWWRITETHNG